MKVTSKIFIVLALTCHSATAAYSQDCNSYLQQATKLVSQKKYCDAKTYYQKYKDCDADADVNTEIAMCERYCKLQNIDNGDNETGAKAVDKTVDSNPPGVGETAQDVIVLKNGDEIKSLVQEVGSDYVKYKKFENQTGPVYTVAISDIFMIKYANGDKDMFNKTAITTNSSIQTNGQNSARSQNENPTTDSSIQNNRQNSYRSQNENANRNENTDQNVSEYRHRYPGLSFLFSFLYPGIGQFYNGQAGKGIVMTVLATGSLATIIGITDSSTDSYGYTNISDDNATAIGVATIVLVGTYLWSIIDAPISANAINRRNEPLTWNVGKTSKLSITPDVLTSNILGIKTNYHSPAYGLSLKLDF